MADQAGDALLEQKYSLDFEKETSYHDSRDYKFTYPSLMEAQIRKLKQCLENWREIILQVKNIFLWEKQWHPTALIGGSTIMFTVLWLLDPSILTVVSSFGLCFTICDYLIPSIAISFFKPEKWTTKKEKDFEDLCTNLILYKAKLELTWAYYYKLKTTNRKMYFVVTTACLSVLAWIGCTFNNLFLAYVLVTFVLLLPGMEHNGMIKKSSAYIQSFLIEFLKQAKSKVAQDKKDN